MSIFDPNDFLNSALTESVATKRELLPVGTVPAQIMKIEAKSGEKDGKKWVRLDAQLEITDPQYLQPTGQEKAVKTYGIMLDVDDNGMIQRGKGKNVMLGKFLEAAKCNQPGKRPSDAVGNWILIQIVHEPDRQDSSITRDNIKSVAGV